MESKPEATLPKRPAMLKLSPLAAVAVSATMLYWGTGLHPLWWLIWLAPLPILLIAARSSALYSFLIGAIAWFLGSLNLWHYAHDVIELPLPVILIFLILPSCFFGLAVFVHRRFVRRGALWKAAFSFPIVWVTYEFLNALTSPHSTFGNLGYTQMDFLPVVQIASLVGIWGITFCLFLLPATVAALLSNHSTGNGSGVHKLKLAAVNGLILLAVLVFGWARLLLTPPADHSVRIGLVAIGMANPSYQQKETGNQLIREISEQTARFAAQGVEVVVLPEKIVIVPDEKLADFDSLLGEIAGKTRSFVLAGLDRGNETRRFNEARLYSADGTVTATYDKHHMIPGIEAVDVPGTTRTILNQPSGIWGIEICKDLDFPALSRQYGASGVALVLVPAWDFRIDGWLHGRMAVMRGVESGFTIARAASEGRLSISDDRGRVLAEQSAAIRFPTLYLNTPVRYVNTLYVRWGDWFGWLNVVALLLILFIPIKK